MYHNDPNERTLIHAVTIDAKDRFLWFNRQAEEANGVRSRDMKGIRSDDLFPDDGTSNQIRWQVRKTGQPHHALLPTTLLTERPVWFDVSWRPDAAGNVLVECIDVTSRVQLASRRTLDLLLGRPRQPPHGPTTAAIARLAVERFSAHEIAMALAVSIDVVAATLVSLAR